MIERNQIETSQLEANQIETNQIETSQSETRKTEINSNCDSGTKTTSCNIPQHKAAIPDGCTTSMDPQHYKIRRSGFTDDKMTPEYSIGAEDALAAQQSLQLRIARLKQTVLSLRKLESAQRGNFLVREYQLRTELEGLCEDVLFLGDKRDGLEQTLGELRAKNTEILDSGTNDNKDETETQDDKPIKVGTGVSDAGVQTDEWPVDHSVR